VTHGNAGDLISALELRVERYGADGWAPDGIRSDYREVAGSVRAQGPGR
jgi:hypothetical protein